eukprot:7880273-Alexandrium_andersonii.AAC.1
MHQARNFASPPAANTLPGVVASGKDKGCKARLELAMSPALASVFKLYQQQQGNADWWDEGEQKYVHLRCSDVDFYKKFGEALQAIDKSLALIGYSE